MSRNPSLLDVIRAIAAGSSVNWDAVGSSAADATLDSVLEQLKIIATIADVHGAGKGYGPADAVPGEHLQSWGPLTVLEQVAAGSYGVVYRAWDSRLDREVALKLLRRTPVHADDEPTVEEGRLLARVRHGNVVTVHGADRIDGRVGIWMEFIDGRTLAAIVRDDGPLDVTETIRIGVEVSRGLASVHAAELIHRDIKAQNVMRQADGRIVLMDFGAGVHGNRDPLPSLVGTPLYIAPEVLAGAPATPQSDIYMVGVLLFFLLTGEHPVAGRTVNELRRAHAERRTASLQSLRPDVPRRLARVVERAMAAQPDRRFEAATDLASALIAVRQTPRRLLMGAAAAAAIIGTAFAARTVDRMFASNRNNPVALAVGMSARQVEWQFPWLFLGSPSPDGRWLSYTDAKTGNLALLDLASGATTLVTGEASMAASRYVTSSRFSTDGERIAYSWYQGDRAGEIRLTDTRGGGTRTLLHDDSAADAGVLAWSHDGSRLAVRIEQRDGQGRLEVVVVGTGERKPITLPMIVSAPAGAAFSPDDRFLVVDAAPMAQGPRRLHMIDLYGGADELLLAGEDDEDAEPFWVGDHVLFSSTRGGKRGIWQVPVVEGRASGVPTLVSDQLANGFWSVGFTDNGSFYYAAAEGIASVYTAAVGGSFEIGTPSRLSGDDARAVFPEWSPDGREVVWVARPVAGGQRAATLRFHDVASGRERTMTTAFVPGANLRWSPDGTRLLVRGTDDKGGGVRMIDARTGRLLDSYLVGRPGDVLWSADGSHLFYIDPKARTIGRIDVSTGAEHPFYVLPAGQQFERGFAVSPAEDQMAFAAVRGDEVSIVTIPVGGGSGRSLLTVRAPHRIGIQRWTRDGQRVLFVRSRAIPGAPLSQEWQLWAVDRNGGEPQYLDFSMPNLSDVRPSPDGRALVFSSSNAENRLRVLEHVFSGSATQGK